MANSKISALTSATTPLAGTEVLPIVQGGVTVKVANNDLRPKQIQSNATTGVLQVAGPTAGTTRVMTTPDANFTAARTDAAQSFTGDQTLATGNLIQGTAAKGINFTANTGAAGMTSQLLNWYEEGTWTPDLLIAGGNTGVTYTSRSGRYTRIGRMVEIECSVVLSSKGARTGAVRIGGLPYTLAIDALPATIVPTGTWMLLLAGGGVQAYISGTAVYLLLGTTTGTTSLTDANLSNTSAFTFTATFTV